MSFEDILKVLLVCALIGTAGALILGIFHLFHDKEDSGERSNKMMRYRIFFQALAILIFSFLLFLHGK